MAATICRVIRLVICTSWFIGASVHTFYLVHQSESIQYVHETTCHSTIKHVPNQLQVTITVIIVHRLVKKNHLIVNDIKKPMRNLSHRWRWWRTWLVSGGMGAQFLAIGRPNKIQCQDFTVSIASKKKFVGTIFILCFRKIRDLMY